MLETEEVIGYPVVTDDREKCIEEIVLWLESDKGSKYFVCANPHSLVTAEDDPLFMDAIRTADLITPDGVGILIASRIIGGNIKDRITGSDVFRELSVSLNKKGGFSYFFLGSTDSILKRIKDKLARDYPNIEFAGSFSPPYKSQFSDEDSRVMIGAVNVAKPDILWVGMTAPKQEKWIYENRDKLGVKFIGAIGAVFDFYTGNVKRSHPFFLKTGLEWLPRLLQEPRRLWRRNFVSNPRFLLRVIRQRLFG